MINSTTMRRPQYLVNSSMRPDLATRVAENTSSAVSTALVGLRSSLSWLYEMAAKVSGGVAHLTPAALREWFASVGDYISIITARVRDNAQVWWHVKQVEAALHCYKEGTLTEATYQIVRTWPEAVQKEFTQRQQHLAETLVEEARQAYVSASEVLEQVRVTRAPQQNQETSHPAPPSPAMLRVSPSPSFNAPPPPTLSPVQFSSLTPNQRETLIRQYESCIDLLRGEEARSLGETTAEKQQ